MPPPYGNRRDDRSKAPRQGTGKIRPPEPPRPFKPVKKSGCGVYFIGFLLGFIPSAYGVVSWLTG